MRNAISGRGFGSSASVTKGIDRALALTV